MINNKTLSYVIVLHLITNDFICTYIKGNQIFITYNSYLPNLLIVHH